MKVFKIAFMSFLGFKKKYICCGDELKNSKPSIVKRNGHQHQEGHKQQPTIDAETVVGSTKWLALKTIEWTDDEGRSRKWDLASRTTKQHNVPDAVVIVTILKSKDSSSVNTILVEQYRPPIGDYSLEFPAGLVDQNETAEAAALRELKEETGYIGIIDNTFAQDELCMSPGLCDETIQIVVVNVDLDDPRNQKPEANPDDGESIKVRVVPLTTGLKQVLSETSGMPISLLYSFAIGLEMGAKYLK